MKVAVVGVTGMVGTVMLKVLEELSFPIQEIVPVASEKSLGQKIRFKEKDFDVVTLNQAIKMDLDLSV